MLRRVPLLLAFVVVSVLPAKSQNMERPIYLLSRCSETIHVAVGRFSQAGGWQAEGFWRLAASTTSRGSALRGGRLGVRVQDPDAIKHLDAEFIYVYAFGEVPNARYRWSGEVAAARWERRSFQISNFQNSESRSLMFLGLPIFGADQMTEDSMIGAGNFLEVNAQINQQGGITISFYCAWNGFFGKR